MRLAGHHWWDGQVGFVKGVGRKPVDASNLHRLDWKFRSLTSFLDVHASDAEEIINMSGHLSTVVYLGNSHEGVWLKSSQKKRGHIWCMDALFAVITCEFVIASCINTWKKNNFLENWHVLAKKHMFCRPNRFLGIWHKLYQSEPLYVQGSAQIPCNFLQWLFFVWVVLPVLYHSCITLCWNFDSNPAELRQKQKPWMMG